MSATPQPRPDRRTVLKALGAGGAALAAGCLGGPRTGRAGADGSEGESEPTAAADGLDPAKAVDVERVAADPTDIPPPIDRDEPRRHEIALTCEEAIAEVEPGVTFRYMTFDGRIPGPMIRVRRGDTIHLTLENEIDSRHPHNVDFHALYGPGGGAEHTTVATGESAEIEFTPRYPGAHIYHCAIPNMDHHISAGMFGAILVEPEAGLPEVDRELYFGQHELYTAGEAGEEGHHPFDYDAVADEDPTYVVYNGEVYAFTEEGYGPVLVDRGDRVRIYLANGGPNLLSSWHAIGNVWKTFYRDGDLVSEPGRYVETAPVAPGTVAAAEIDTPVPGPIKLVDHALSRVLRKGLLGVIRVEGEPNPEVYDPDP